ncbi:MAG: IS91 family transposase [Bacteroidales bacterium]|nr:IS91 family transposase [Bacteroidales bacterium]
MWNAQTSVGEIFRRYGDEFLSKHHLPVHWLKAIEAIKLCRTAELGGHVEKCTSCGHTKVHYNSCGNRHCPQCQGVNREKWVLEKQYDQLPVPYFHAVFTVPQELHPLFRYNRTKLYNFLFSCTWETLNQFASNPENRLNAKIGAIMVLHTWTQQLEYHPHVHCIVPAGGIDSEENWKNATSNGGFLFYFKALANTFRGKFLWYLREMYDKNELELPGKLGNKNQFVLLVKTLKNKQWNVKIKDSLPDNKHVIAYLGRYTHRIAIANSRIKSIDNGLVTFSYTDRADNNKQKEKTVTTMEFMQLFVQHFLPKYFMKIRNYGILSSRSKTSDLASARKSLKCEAPGAKKKFTLREVLLITKGIDVEKCPCCGGKMVVTKIIEPLRGPPRKLPLDKTLLAA